MSLAGSAGAAATAPIRAVTFDFANTLVPVDRRGFRAVVELTVDGTAAVCGIADRAAFLVAWDEERDRQFREDVPAGREVDLFERVGRVLARIRGMAPPRVDERWDDAAAVALSSPAERELVVDQYTRSFIHAMPAPAHVGPLLQRLAGRGLRLGVISNWPLSVTIERYLAAAGWGHHLDAVVVSQRVGVIKPHPAIFGVAEQELRVPGAAIIHVGDDWMADVVGAKRAGWRACYLRDQPQDWPRQPVEPDAGVEADLVIARLDDLEAGLEALEKRGSPTP